MCSLQIRGGADSWTCEASVQTTTAEVAAATAAAPTRVAFIREDGQLMEKEGTALMHAVGEEVVLDKIAPSVEFLWRHRRIVDECREKRRIEAAAIFRRK